MVLIAGQVLHVCVIIETISPWGLPRHWKALETPAKAAEKQNDGLTTTVTRLQVIRIMGCCYRTPSNYRTAAFICYSFQALIRGKLSRKTHLPIVRSGTAWGPPVWMKPKAVNDMLELAEASQHDVLYDMGSGHGSVLLAALRDFHVKKAVGVEIDPMRIQTASRILREAGFSEPRVSFLCSSVIDAKARSVAAASIVTCFMSPDAHAKLLQFVQGRCKVGTRVVFYAFHPGKPHKECKWSKTVAHMKDTGYSYLYLFRV